MFVEKEYSCVLRDYLESDCQNLVGLVNRMKDRWDRINDTCRTRLIKTGRKGRIGRSGWVVEER